MISPSVESYVRLVVLIWLASLAIQTITLAAVIALLLV